MNTTRIIQTGDATPWGPAQTVEDMGNGCYIVSTSGHGGMYVPPALHNLIPKCERDFARDWSGSACWYEEDSAIISPIYHLPGVFEKAYPGKPREEMDRIYNSFAEQRGWRAKK